MKTILYNPIFINPQAYYVFPRLTRYLQPDNESTAEPANYIGTIEVKVIAYGDTTLKRTYTNTDSIDLSEFKNTWIRISLFTKVGSCVLGEWKIGNMESDLPYIDPEVLASLKAVVIVGNKTNNDSDRAIVKNLVDPDNPFVISNAAYEGMSGYNGYPVVFGANETWKSLSSVYSYTSDVTSTTIHVTRVKNAGTGLIFSYVKKDGALTNIREIPAFRVTVKGLEGNSKFGYRYLATEDATEETLVYLGNGTHELSKSFTPTEALLDLTRNAWVGIFITPMVEGEVVFDCDITIEVLPEYEGAFVTDGINDLITSTKTVQEMLGGSNEITVVSMIHLVQTPAVSSEKAYTNQIRTGQNYLRNYVTNNGKTGIYGYTYKENNVSVINNILGDKNDYTVENKSWNNLAKFSVIGCEDNGTINELDQVAWYWTIIANKLLTTDQINQVIAYFNLDRTLNPDILCDVKKQGITNENHAKFGDKLIDFSGNGRDIQLNNLAWKGDSGIGKYEVDFLDSSIWNSSNSTITSSKIDCKNAITHIMLLYYSVGSKEYPDIPSFKVIKTGADIDYSYIDETGAPKSVKIVDGVNILPASHNTLYSGSGRFCGFGNPGMGNSVTITQIPSHAGALCLDGVNDFGKVTGMPVYKDYTFIIDRQIISIGDTAGIVASKSEDSTDVNKQGAFLFEYLGGPNNVSAWSFYKDNGKVANTDFTRGISYQSKYSYNGVELLAGTALDSDKLWLGTLRDKDSRFANVAIYSLMSFPYSMSEFLIERQLKKHKLGTLYPDMVEFRPIVKSNVKWDTIEIWQGDKSLYRPAVNDDKTGIYLKKNSTIGIYVKPNVGQKVSEIVCNGVSYTDLKINSNGFYYKVVPITKSPQKINVAIEQDENYVLFNPVINSNYDNYKLTFHLREYEKLINIGDYIPKGTYIRANLYLKNNIDELVTFTFNGVNIDYAKSPVLDTAYNIRQIYNYDSPQEVNITVDEYIRYEDIVQPYPVLLRFKDENGNEVSWGGKVKLGSSITRIGSFNDCNLLKGIYTVSNAKLNGSPLPSTPHVVERQMVFTCTATWTLDNNEPKSILSPRLLRIPNSSYKILGYIPDISGHGNHGVIHNSAYEGASGANGYLQNFSEWTKASGVSSTDSVISSSNNLVAANGWIAYVTSGTVIPTFKVEISGIPVNGNLRFEGSDQTLVNGVNTIQGITTTKVTGFYISSGYDNDWSNLKIEQIGEYEGAYCFDGVDDFVAIPTITGGKQVLMKVNWDSPNVSILYDQRGYNNEFAIHNGMKDSDGNPIPAYQGRNNGQTYIDGILNSNIKASELRAITHNITITNELSSGANKTYPIIGSSKSNAYFVNMALYDFMLFDEISTDDKILELNEYVGIEGNTE